MGHPCLGTENNGDIDLAAISAARASSRVASTLLAEQWEWNASTR